MNYLDKINDKKSQAKAKADADAILNKIESVKTAIKTAPDSTLSSTLTSYVEELKQQTENYKQLIQNNSEIAKQHDAEVKKMFSDINITLGNLKMPDITVPDIIIPEIKVPKITVPAIKVPENDFSPITDALNSLKSEKGIDLDDYFAQDIKEDGETQYIGFLNPDGAWYIMESTKNTLRFVFGSGNYSKAFDKAASYSYELLNEAINGKV